MQSTKSNLPYSPRHLYYNGAFQCATSNQSFHTINPTNGEPLAEVYSSSQSDIDRAIASAQRAFPTWSTTPPVVRSRILLKAVQILRSRNDELARIETDDTGKPFSETSTVDVATGADVLEYFANMVAGGGLNGDTVHLRPDAWVYTKKEALGVCVGIGAWNYPLQIALWKSAPCLAAGNTMVPTRVAVVPKIRVDIVLNYLSPRYTRHPKSHLYTDRSWPKSTQRLVYHLEFSTL